MVDHIGKQSARIVEQTESAPSPAATKPIVSLAIVGRIRGSNPSIDSGSMQLQDQQFCSSAVASSDEAPQSRVFELPGYSSETGHG
jgi:hypothetical protein